MKRSFSEFTRSALCITLLAVPTTVLAGGLKFSADLSSAQEIPTPAPGFIEKADISAKFASDFTAVDVKLTVHGGQNVVAAHFHCARPGVAGPVVFGLFSPGTCAFDGMEAKCTLTNANFSGTDCTGPVGRPVNNIAALALAMRDGLIYANVHTTQNPPGEVRGQMLENGK